MGQVKINLIMKNNICLISVFTIGILLSSCAYNKKELPAPEENVIQGDPVRYTNFTKLVIDNNCIVCHSSGGGQTPFLTTYNEVAAQKTRVVARAINNIPSIMPPTGALPQNIKDTLQMWLDQGALE